MQYSSRIKVLVENQKDIAKLSSLRNDNFIINKDRKSFCIDGDWSVTEKELLSIVQDIARILKYKCIIVADTWNIDVDPYKFCIYSFGSEVKYRNFENYNKIKLINNSDINSIASWLNATKIRLTEKEKEYLQQNKIEYVVDKKIYVDRLEEEKKNKEEEQVLSKEIIQEEILKNKHIKNEDYDVFYFELVGTQFENREERIRKLNVGDIVDLIREKENLYDSKAVLIKNREGSIGHISSGSTIFLSSMIDNGYIEINKAVVERVIPYSKLGNSKKRGGYVEIKVEYSVTENGKEYYKKLIEKEPLHNDFNSVIFLKVLCKCGLIKKEEIKKYYNISWEERNKRF